ncbi:MAG: 2-C-methyl-D-erythritol 4-phosphate cytidylyltransferase [Lachnospiraceae bacterium]|nr:2-C-methyl-D-erythritol 4-phosphate cytidylyltransferase [Lachnospiraceae bacterium]
MKNVAIVLSAGRGTRMNSDVPKQYMELEGKPVLYYSLKAMEDSFIDEIILVAGADDISYCKEEIVAKYNLSKVKAVVAGGKERYHSVWNGLRCVADADYVFIHDGARPVVKEDVLLRALDGAKECDACVVGVPVKDTIKIVDEEGLVTETPPRNRMFQVQTPQVFKYPLIRSAYERLQKEETALLEKGVAITDDAMVVELLTDTKVKIVMGSYENIKITTPEDLVLARRLINPC